MNKPRSDGLKVSSVDGNYLLSVVNEKKLNGQSPMSVVCQPYDRDMWLLVEVASDLIEMAERKMR